VGGKSEAFRGVPALATPCPLLTIRCSPSAGSANRCSPGAVPPATP